MIEKIQKCKVSNFPFIHYLKSINLFSLSPWNEIKVSTSNQPTTAADNTQTNRTNSVIFLYLISGFDFKTQKLLIYVFINIIFLKNIKLWAITALSMYNTWYFYLLKTPLQALWKWLLPPLLSPCFQRICSYVFKVQIR